MSSWLLRTTWLWATLCLSVSTTIWASPLEDESFTPRVAAAIEWSKRAYLPTRNPQVEVYTDSFSGYRGLITADAATGAIIVSFRGTSRARGVASSIALNYPQFNSPAYLKTMRRVHQILRSRNYQTSVLVTGHSSGGGLAEAFAYELMEDAKRGGRNQLNLDLITWNGIGSQEWFIYRDPKFVPDPEVLNKIHGLHLRADGDFISQLGTHFTGAEWTWSHDGKTFNETHAIPTSVDALKQRLTATQVDRRLTYFTGNAVGRATFLHTSHALLGTITGCQVLLKFLNQKK